MKRVRRDEAREKRIDMEILIDAYDEEARAMGWYYYLVESMRFPFKATCVIERHNSPLKENDRIEVLRMAEATECLHDMLVEIDWQDDPTIIPLCQVEGIDVDELTQQSIEDWHYWVARGYGF